MDKHLPPDHAASLRKTAGVTNEPAGSMPHLIAAAADLPLKQIFKLTLLSLSLIAWWPIYARLNPFRPG